MIGNKEFKWFTIERDEEEIKALMKAEEEFSEYVKSNTPPPVDGAQSTSKTLKILFPESNEDVVDLSAYGSALQQYMHLSKQIKDLENLREEAANMVKAFMAEAGRGESGAYRCTYTSQERKTFDVKSFAKDHGSIDLAPYYKSSSYRVFKVTERK